MVSSVKMILALTVLATAACTGYAIRCYECDSVIDSKCGKDFKPDSVLISDCSPIQPSTTSSILKFKRSDPKPVIHATGCMKRTLEKPGNPHIVRSCYFGNISNTKVGCQYNPNNKLSKFMNCAICTEDKCNGSSSLAPIAGVILFFGLARLLA
ncbi:uncharacterized protein LOC6556103 [Drosophila erecta]|uniref:Uncharacterized protein n=1 Tax=Drosophila erecta TaxID=7220 RepID=B3NKW9_DROER|nr:uncharacterized protein LOC6548762 [Drosophila erecta]XP_001982962.2 uncharacterized protein LOC6556103 [Drosophila erecta]EDV54492.2 uncharacterized protein Dere_GG21268 [Drosophila erecta]